MWATKFIAPYLRDIFNATFFLLFYLFVVIDTFVVMVIWVVEATPLVLVVVSITFLLHSENYSSRVHKTNLLSNNGSEKRKE